MTTHEFLRSAWLSLLSPWEQGDLALTVFADLATRHAEPARHYHTFDHIAAVLRTLYTLAPASGPTAAQSFAGFFHDAIYDPRAQDNEQRSADLARETLTRANVPVPIIEEAVRLIQLTRTHEAEDASAEIFLDADLAILGALPADYEIYARAIRQEYAWVPEAAYRAGRTAILERFLAREWIFFTDRLRNQSEAQARDNLNREIRTLAS